MRKLLASAFVGLMAGLALVWAQPGSAWLIQVPGAAPPAYTGPGDLATFTAFYSFRAFTGAIAAAGTQKLIHLIRASDSHACDVIVATAGGMGNTSSCGTGGDNGQTAASFCNATTCSGYFYDQVSTNDLSNNVGSAYPDFTLNCINTSLPCFTGNTTTQAMRTAANYTPGAVGSLYAVANRTVQGTGNIPMIAENGSDNTIQTRSAVANNWTLHGGVTGNCINVTASDAAPHLGIGIINGASSSFIIDGGAPSTATCTGSTTAGRIGSIILSADTTNVLEVMELGFKDSATVWTSTELSNLHTNAAAYWGTP